MLSSFFIQSNSLMRANETRREFPQSTCNSMILKMNKQAGDRALMGAILILSIYVTLTKCQQQAERATCVDLQSTKKIIKLKQSNETTQSDSSKMSYVIEGRRFFEPSTSRCHVSIIPKDPMSLEPSFVFIKAGLDEEVRLNATVQVEVIKAEADFDPSKGTFVLVHGFLQSYPKTVWLRKIRDLFRQNHAYDRYNLIIMDWSTAARGSYRRVAAATNVMGSFLSNMLMKLIELGADPKSIHLIGHSIGCHLVGFAGKKTSPKIGRITALDPAGPCFKKPGNRLAVEDAHQVAIYHYNDGFLGLPGQHGHLDVFVNGGSSQPGAKDNFHSMLSAIFVLLLKSDKALSESHTRSTEVHTAQLAPTNCQQVAYECRDYPAFLSGECGQCDDQNNQCFFMGFPFQYQQQQLAHPEVDRLELRTANYPGKRMFLVTSAKDSFCLQHYQILVKFEPQQELIQQARRHGWRLYLELTNERQETLNITLKNQLAPGVYSYLLLSESPPVRFVSALLQMRQSSDDSVVVLSERYKHGFLVNTIEVNFMSHKSPNVRRSLSSALCPSKLPTWHFNSIADSSALDSPDWLAFAGCTKVSGDRWPAKLN